MKTLNMHCNMDEQTFSLMAFLTRLLTAGVLLYLTAGCLLFYREYLYNVAVIGFPMPVGIGLGVLIGQLFLSFLLILGLFSRFVSIASVIFLSLEGFVFFGAELNKIYVALVLLFIAALLPTLLMGPGKYSLDFNRARRRIEKEFRG